MARIVLINLLMFLLPFLVYGGYVYLVRRRQAPDSIWRGAPIGWLAVAGFVLALATLAALITFSGWDTGGTYTPPRYEDGVIVPGRVD